MAASEKLKIEASITTGTNTAVLHIRNLGGTT
jgi:hypothetical protein